jgi:hypothetical protein
VKNGVEARLQQKQQLFFVINLKTPSAHGCDDAVDELDRANRTSVVAAGTDK